MTTMFPAISVWVSLLLVSIACDVCASAYLKVAGDRLQGLGFFWATVVGVAAFAPSIITFGYAMKLGSSYIATVGVWAVGVYVANAVVGVMAFDDQFSWRAVVGMGAACVAVVMLAPTN